MDTKQQFLSLCYHYIRPDEGDVFSDVLGATESELIAQIDELEKHYDVISPDDVGRFFGGEELDIQNDGLLFTFDDGLEDHYRAAKLLAKRGIKALFFIPTCIVLDKLPANPTITHYFFAMYRVDGFIEAFNEAWESIKPDVVHPDFQYSKGKDDVWKVIGVIKQYLKYGLKPDVTREILLHMYDTWMLRDRPDMFEVMHLTHEQINEMIEMGHMLGTHSHTHISVAAHELSEEVFQKEIIEPKKILEDTFGCEVSALSYPFGKVEDCLKAGSLLEKTSEYTQAYTVNQIVNTRAASPFEIGRYMPLSIDYPERLLNILDLMKQGRGHEVVQVKGPKTNVNVNPVNNMSP